MFIEGIIKEEKKYFWTIFHVLLGVLSSLSPWVFRLWFYLLFIGNLPKLTASSKSPGLTWLPLIMIYLVSLEFLGRLAVGSPLVPYELSKYLMVSMPLFLLFQNRKSSSLTGIALILLTVPAFFYDFTGYRRWADIVYNLGGPLGLAMGVWLFGAFKLDRNNRSLNLALRLIWLAALCALASAIFKTPEFENIQFGYGANYATTGGQPSNQAATIFGLGMFLSFYAWLNRLKFSGYRNLDALIFIGFAFQGLLTFSRGGMIVGAFGVLLLSYFYLRSNRISLKTRNRYLANFSLATIFLVLVFFQVNSLSGGILVGRYAGETQATSMGLKEKTLDVVTSGRLSILSEDISLWLKNPILGLGGGSSSHARDSREGMNAHIEMTRLLVDQGLPGLLYFLILISIGWRIWNNNGMGSTREILLILFLIGFLTSFHSAMRTFVTPLLIALSSLGTRKV